MVWFMLFDFIFFRSYWLLFEFRIFWGSKDDLIGFVVKIKLVCLEILGMLFIVLFLFYIGDVGLL